MRHEGKYAKVTTEADQGMVGISYIGEEKTQLVQESDLTDIWVYHSHAEPLDWRE